MAPQTLPSWWSWECALPRGQFWRQYFCLLIPAILANTVSLLTASVMLAWLLRSMFALLAVLILFLIIKRLHDVGKSGWWSLFLLAPFINVYIVYLLFFKKGT